MARDNIIESSLDLIVKINPKDYGGHDPLKKPITIRFLGEPGIDEGGVRKEYFRLCVEELMNPQYAMFKYQDDVRLYWINGTTFEPNLKYELIGTLMGIAIYNNTFINLQFPSACYKILLDQELDLEDLRLWQPETANSLQFMLDYDETEHGMPLEDMVERTFTVTVENWGAHEEVELIPNGANIKVTKKNVKRFIKLFIDWTFIKQCES